MTGTGHEHRDMGTESTLAVLLSEAPSVDVRGAAARRLLRAAKERGHAIAPVFFYGDAVATPLTPGISEHWAELARALELRLAVCPAATTRRGLTLGNDPAPFEVLGLPAWLDLALRATRIVRL